MTSTELHIDNRMMAGICPVGTVLIEKKTGQDTGYTGSIVVEDALVEEGVAELKVKQALFSNSGLLLASNSRNHLRQMESNVCVAPAMYERIGASAICGVADDHVGVFFDPSRVAVLRLMSSMEMNPENMNLMVKCDDIFELANSVSSPCMQAAKVLMQDPAVLEAVNNLDLFN